jgi:hypothetical protein
MLSNGSLLASGQISGFLEMDNFKERFGVFDPETSTYAFPTTRSGVIVAIVGASPAHFPYS